MRNASATEEADSGSIPDRAKPKTTKIGTHSFPAWRSAIKRFIVKPQPREVDIWAAGILIGRPKRFICCLLTEAS